MQNIGQKKEHIEIQSTSTRSRLRLQIDTTEEILPLRLPDADAKKFENTDPSNWSRIRKQRFRIMVINAM